MAYKYSTGYQVMGDISGSDDANRNTGIDFEEDYIGFVTSGSTSMVLSGSRIGIGTTTPDSTLHIAGNVHISGSDQEGLRIAKGDDDYRQLVFENDGVDAASFTLSNSENLVIMNETAGKDIQFWVDSAAGGDIQTITIKESGKVGVVSTDPIAELDVAGKIAITAEVSTPSQPSDGQGFLYAKSDGKLYWRSYDVAETDLTQTGGGGGGGSSASLEVTSQKTSDYTASNGDFVLVNLVGAAGDVTITLPAASSDAQVAIKIAGAANGKIVTVDGNSSQTIDGATTRTMDSDYESMHLISDGSNWWRIT